MGSLLLSAYREGASGASASSPGAQQAEQLRVSNTGVPHLTLSARVTKMTDPTEITSQGYRDKGLWFVSGLCLHGASWVPTATDGMTEDSGTTLGAHGQFERRPVHAQLPITVLGVCSRENTGLEGCVPVYHSRRKGKTLVAALDFTDACGDCSWARASSILLEN